MYKDYFNLKKDPFDNSFDPDLVFLSGKQVETLTLSLLAIGEGKEAVILTGAKGSGKSSLLRMIMSEFPEREILYLRIPPRLSLGEFLSQLADKLRVDKERKTVPGGLSEIIFSSVRNIFNCSRAILFIDDAHLISDGRILTEFEELLRARVTLNVPLTIFLTGLPELLSLVDSRGSLLAEISLKLNLPDISVEFLAGYFKFRLSKSGCSSDIFPEETISFIHRYSQGDLKKVNLLAKLGLIIACQRGLKRVTTEALKNVLLRYSDLVMALLPQREKVLGKKDAPAEVAEEMLSLLETSVGKKRKKQKVIKEVEAGGYQLKVPVNEKENNAEDIYSDFVNYLSLLVSQAEKGDKLDLKPVEGYAKQLVSSLKGGNELIFQALKPMPEYHLPRHMANVGIIAAKIGFGLNYPEEELVRLAEVALVHDIGMVRVSRAIIEKPGKLTPEEFELVKEHPRYTYELIKEAGDEFHWMAEIAYQEHEKHQGQGYPRGLKGEEIHPFASIIQAADMFEAFSHPRAWRRRFIAHDALQKVIKLREDFLPGSVIKAMVNEFSLFPLNSYFQLNNGEIGRVIEIEKDNLLRPKVEIVYDAKGNRLKTPKFVNLKENPFLCIKKSIDEEELPR
jgi:HD-GYP domain-containing protein (c-di-GMP phosphodiesterase class II)